MAVDTISWPSDFPELKKIDVLLKCGICYDYMSTTMMTSCCHNYCSLCIRKSMQYKRQCPTCFEETYESGLRNNRPLDEVIILYTKIRDKLLKAIRLAALVKEGKPLEVSSPVPERISEAPITPKPEHCVTPKITSKSKKNFFAPKASVSTTPTSSRAAPELPTESPAPSTSKVPKMFISSPKNRQNQPPKPKELTPCPVCNVDIPTRNINVHLDACLAAAEGKAKPKIEDKPQPRRDPLPKRLYHLLAEKDLKKYCKEYGLNPQGDRRTLVSRLQKFTVLYNSENDTLKPRSRLQLVQQIEREEREEKKHNNVSTSFKPRIFFNRNTFSEDIEKVNQNYMKENKDSFQQLIENMRQREGRNIRPLKPAPRIESDDEDAAGPSTSVENNDPDYFPDFGHVSKPGFEVEPPVRPKRSKRLFSAKIEPREIERLREDSSFEEDTIKEAETNRSPPDLEESLYESIFHGDDSSNDFESIFNASFSMKEKTESTPLSLARRGNKKTNNEEERPPSPAEIFDLPTDEPPCTPENRGGSSQEELCGFESSNSIHEDASDEMKEEENYENSASMSRKSKRKAASTSLLHDEPRRSQRKKSKTSS